MAHTQSNSKNTEANGNISAGGDSEVKSATFHDFPGNKGERQESAPATGGGCRLPPNFSASATSERASVKSSFLKIFEERKAARQAKEQEKKVAKEMAKALLSEPSVEDQDDQIPLRQRKRKATADPEGIPAISVGGGEDTNATCPDIDPPSTSSAALLPLLNSQEVRENIFQEQGSVTGAQMLLSLLSPIEESFLSGIRPTKKFFEGAARALTGAQMLVSAFADVEASSKKEEKKVLAARSLYKNLKSELDRTKEIHIGEIFGMQQLLDSKNDELDASRYELQRLRVEAEVTCIRAESFRSKSDLAEARVKSLADKVGSLKAELREVSLSRANAETEWRAKFLASPEFKEAVTAQSFSCFEKCQEKFEKNGLCPDDRENFSDFDRAIASVSEEEPKE